MRGYGSGGGSSINYDAQRRRRRWSQQGMQGYAAFLLGDDTSSAVEQSAAATGAVEAASVADGPSTALRSIAIGVATGAITFLVNRWLSKVIG